MSFRHLIAATGLVFAASTASAGSSFSFEFGTGGTYVDLAWWNPDWYLVADYETPTTVVVEKPVYYKPVFCDPIWVDYDDYYCEPAVVVRRARIPYYYCDPWNYSYSSSYTSYGSSWFFSYSRSYYSTFTCAPAFKPYAWDYCPTPVYYRYPTRYHAGIYYDHYNDHHYDYHDDFHHDKKKYGPYSRSKYENRREVNRIAPSRQARPHRPDSNAAGAGVLASTRPSVSDPRGEPIRRALPAGTNRPVEPIGTTNTRRPTRGEDSVPGVATVLPGGRDDSPRRPIRATDPRTRGVDEGRKPVIRTPEKPSGSGSAATRGRTARRPLEATTRKPTVTRNPLGSVRKPTARQPFKGETVARGGALPRTKPTTPRTVKPETGGSARSPVLRTPRTRSLPSIGGRGSTGARPRSFDPIQPRSFPTVTPSDSGSRKPSTRSRTSGSKRPTFQSPRAEPRTSVKKPTVRDYRTLQKSDKKSRNQAKSSRSRSNSIRKPSSGRQSRSISSSKIGRSSSSKKQTPSRRRD